MKKGIHPKLNDVTVTLGNGFKFVMKSTYKKSNEIFYAHSPLSKENLKKRGSVGNAGMESVKKFQDKYGDLFGDWNNDTDNKDENTNND